MKPETAERIRKAINDIEESPLGGTPLGPEEMATLKNSVAVLTAVARAFVSTHMPLSDAMYDPLFDDPLPPDVGSPPVAGHLDPTDCITDIAAHAGNWRTIIDFINRESLEAISRNVLSFS